MKHFRVTLLFLCVSLSSFSGDVGTDEDYLEYHRQITEAESLIAEERYEEALRIYNNVFSSYDFIFVRDYKVATQLAWYMKDRDQTFGYLHDAVKSGWTLKSIKKNDFLKPLRKEPEWKKTKKDYDRLRTDYAARLNKPLRESVHEMSRQDQKKALGALFRIGDKAQTRYAEKKFEPHSVQQMHKLIEILDRDGYPGEKLIGNSFWMSTILSHHNSISPEYCKKDTLYTYVRPQLLRSVAKGEMSPYEYALVDDWRTVVEFGRDTPGYGFLSQPTQATLEHTDMLRQGIGLRTVELRNKLIDIESKTGMNFYLPSWVKGKIKVVSN
ncbi:MAG: hypothetical protein KDC99_06315 [Cyclobacteriaceae bacterium]|nr:hypothetical protein [Cyclobacteriaceae bacterium]